jgi:hypothetical protein
MQPYRFQMFLGLYHDKDLLTLIKNSIKLNFTF